MCFLEETKIKTYGISVSTFRHLSAHQFRHAAKIPTQPHTRFTAQLSQHFPSILFTWVNRRRKKEFYTRNVFSRAKAWGSTSWSARASWRRPAAGLESPVFHTSASGTTGMTNGSRRAATVSNVAPFEVSMVPMDTFWNCRVWKSNTSGCFEYVKKHICRYDTQSRNAVYYQMLSSECLTRTRVQLKTTTQSCTQGCLWHTAVGYIFLWKLVANLPWSSALHNGRREKASLYLS